MVINHRFRIDNAIKKCHSEDYGRGWDAFWDFYNIKESHSISNRQLAVELFCYLVCFGMGRHNTKLLSLDIIQFTKLVEDIRPIIDEISIFKFGMLKREHEENYNQLFNKIKNELKKNEISNTDLMVSKILMATTGQAVAVDIYFKNTFKHCFGTFPTNYYEVLLEVQIKYINFWKDRIDALDTKYKLTRPFDKNIIPPARLIDMAFWWWGQDD